MYVDIGYIYTTSQEERENVDGKHDGKYRNDGTAVEYYQNSHYYNYYYGMIVKHGWLSPQTFT